jgi:D-tyrosyl-tRNA(Tyr) deacylase
MRAVVQRVASGSVSIDGKLISAIGNGLVVLLGVAEFDRRSDAEYLAEKIAHLRIFKDRAGKMNRSLMETGGEMLVVSQFTLLGDCRKGRRPSFIAAAKPDAAEILYTYFVASVSKKNLRVKTGRFGAMMQVSLINEGPVTLILDSVHS